ELAEIPEMVERFVREARAVNLIRHPNIVDIFDFGTTQDGRPYFVMELLEGRDLDSLLRTDGRLSPDETFEILDQVCAALSCAHEAGFVHRDLKAANVVVIQNADQRIAKLLDFGIAKLLQPDPALASLTTSARRLGTPHAMAPEQIRGDAVTPQTDIYAIGVLLYYMLTGRTPF